MKPSHDAHYIKPRLAEFDRHFQGNDDTLDTRLISFIVRRGRPGLAQRLCRLALAVAPDKTAPAAYQLFFLWTRNETRALKTMCRESIFRFPGHWYFRWMYADQLAKEQQTGMALSVLGVPQPDTEHFFILQLRLRLYYRYGDWQLLRQVGKVAKARFPGQVWPVKPMIRACIAEGELSRGEILVQDACRRFPQNASLHQLAATIYTRLGDLRAAHRHLSTAVELTPTAVEVVGAFLVSIQRLLEQDRSIAALDKYLAWSRTHAADLQVLKEISSVTGAPPDSRALRLIADAGPCEVASMFEPLLAKTMLEDFSGAVRLLKFIFDTGAWDLRISALLRLHGERFAPLLAEAKLASLPILAAKLEQVAASRLERLHLHSAPAGYTGRPPDSSRQDSPDCLVSIICPIHRKDDVQNLMTQLHHQRWKKLEVIMCVNNPEINESDVKLDESLGLRQIFITAEPGRTIGYYLNRSIEQASGDYVLRVDADDYYGPDYVGYMVECARTLDADIASMDLCTFYFADIDQTYLTRPPRSRAELEYAIKRRHRIGSGSSMCTRRHVFQDMRFDESLRSGEDGQFYYRAINAGFRVRLVPDRYHTAVRKTLKHTHTWQVDDFQLLKPVSILLGRGPRYLVEHASQSSDDLPNPYDRLFNSPCHHWLQELQLAEILADIQQPLRLIVAEDSQVPEGRYPGLQVSTTTGDIPPEELAIVFMPGAYAAEYAISRKINGLSMSADILPELAWHNRRQFRSAGFANDLRSRDFGKQFASANHRYVIVANPRSGTEYFCGLMQSLGLADPRELIREPAATVLSFTNDFDDFLPRLFAPGVVDEIFGTKIISQYLFDFLGDRKISSLFDWLLQNQFKIIYISRPTVDTAISAYIAEQRGVWHAPKVAGTSIGIATSEHGSLPEYDFEAIAGFMKLHSDWTEALDHHLQQATQAGHVYHVQYQSLVEAPQATMQQVVNWLGVPILPRVEAISRVRPMTRKSGQLESMKATFLGQWSRGRQGD